MALARLKDWAYPERIEDVKDVDKYLRAHYMQHVEESQSRIEDFENLEIDTLAVGSWTIETSFKPLTDAAVDLGAVGATDYRFRHLYLSGNLSDETNTLTVANAKGAYDKRVDTWGNGLEYSSQTAAVDYNTTNLKITSNELDTIQSIATGASPTFTALGLGTGELTAGSINRASGTMTLEIAGSTVQSIQAGVVSLGYSDTAKLSLLNASSAERAYFQLSTTNLHVYADSGVYFYPNNSLAGGFTPELNFGINTATFGTSAASVLGLGAATAPTTAPANITQLWSADRDGTAGDAALHYRMEGGLARPFDRMYDVRDYGASSAESAANNRTYIQAAIDAAPTSGTVIIPRMSAVYDVDNTTPLVIGHGLTVIVEGEINFTDGNDPNEHDFCDVTGNDVVIYGGGKIKGDGNFDQSGAVTSAVFHVTGDRFNLRDITIEDPVQCGVYLIGTANSVISGVRIIGGPAAYSAPQSYGIEMEAAGTYGVLISNCAVIPNAGGGVVCQGIASGASVGGHITVTGCYVEGTHDNGVYLVASNSTVTGNTFNNITSSLKVIGKYNTITSNTLNSGFMSVPNCEGSVIMGNHINDYESVGIDIYNYSSYAGTYNDIIVANNILKGKANLSLTGIRVRTEAASGRNIQIINNIIQNADDKGDQYDGIQVYADDGDILERVKIDGNTIDTIGDSGIVVKNVSQGSISNNLIRDPAQQTANMYGIRVVSGCDDLYIANNRIAKETGGAGAMPYGIIVTSSASNTNCIVENNKITGDGTGEVYALRSEGHQLFLTDSDMVAWFPDNVAFGFDDACKISLYDSAAAERARLFLASGGTVLGIGADSDITINPNNTLAATFTAAGVLQLTEICLQGDDIWDNSDNEGGAIVINNVGKDGGTTQFKNFSIRDGKGTPIATFIGSDKGVHLPGLKTGTTQGGAGASEGELWVDTDDDNTVKLGAST